jgi:peptidoglycan/xylan/chitin deacetylase (PgdA/CDA1 family)
VSFILNYEEGGERSVIDGDPLAEPYLWEKGTSGGVKEGARHLNTEHDFEYGSRVGCWRIFRLMKEFGWNMTLWAIAKAMERNQPFAKACIREGHEMGVHGGFLSRLATVLMADALSRLPLARLLGPQH